MGVTRATMSHGVRRTTSRLESLRTTALSTAKPAAVAADIAAATARRLSAACISVCPLRWPVAGIPPTRPAYGPERYEIAGLATAAPSLPGPGQLRRGEHYLTRH